MRALGDVMHLRRTPIVVKLTQEYTEIGIRSFGRGIFHKSPIVGIELGKKRVFEIRPGDLVFSNVFAWEGAVAMATSNDLGCIGSHRFMTYEVDPDEADAAYLRYLFLSEGGLELLRGALPGSAGRNRTLAIDRLEALRVALPRPPEQRRIAARLDGLLEEVGAISSHSAASAKLAHLATARLVDGILALTMGEGWTLEPLGQIADVNPRPVRPDSEMVSFVPMAAVDERLGVVAHPELRPTSSVAKGYKLFRDGDVIFARITPCMQNGKSAVVERLATDVAAGSTEFHVIRPGGRVSARLIHAVIRSAAFREAAKASFTGTAGQQRVPASFLEKAVIPVPPSPEKEAEVISRIDAVMSLRYQLEAAMERSRALSAALRVSLLNEAFSGQF